MLALTGPHGWHAEVHVAGTGIADQADLIRSLEAPVVIDHLARIDPAGETSVATLEALLDAGRLAQALRRRPDVAAALRRRRRGRAPLSRAPPDRAVWGTDFPHPNHAEPVPDDGELAGLLPWIAATTWTACWSPTPQRSSASSSAVSRNQRHDLGRAASATEIRAALAETLSAATTAPLASRTGAAAERTPSSRSPSTSA